MSDLSIRTFSGAGPTMTTRPAQPGPPAAQQAVAQPVSNPQSAVIQVPNAANIQQQNSHQESGIQQQSLTGQQKPSSAAPSSEDLKETVNYLNRFLQRFDTALQFDIDQHYGEMVVRIVDRQNQEVIRQIPSEETLAFAKFFKDLEEHGADLPEPINGSGTPDSPHLKIEGLLLDTHV